MSAELNIDLHSHSTFSDGALTPTQLVDRAAAAGIQWLALTDHDTVDGLAEARAAALQHGSTAWKSRQPGARNPCTSWVCGSTRLSRG
jgi:histidinol phosphatase-like PHP family hydrolase